MQNLVQIITNPQKGNVQNLSNTKNDSKIGDTLSSDDSKGFVSILFEQIKGKSQKVDSKTKSTDKNEFLTKIDTDSTPKSTDQLLLNEVLNILNTLEISASDEKPVSFPKFTDKMQTILSDEESLQDFKSIKNMDDVLKFSKKYDLNLEKLNITQEKLDDIKNSFPNLDKKGFFDIKENSEVSKLLSKNETFTQNRTHRVTNINKMMQNLSKDGSISNKDDSSKDILQSLLKNVDESSKKVILKDMEEDKKNKVKNFKDSTKKIDTKDIAKKDLRNESIKFSDKDENIKKETKTEEGIVAKKEFKDLNAKEDKKSFKDEKIKDFEMKKADKTALNEDTKAQKRETNQNLEDKLLKDIKPQKNNKQDSLFSQILNSSNEENKENKDRGNELKTETTNTKIEIKPQQKLDTLQSKTTHNLPQKETFDSFANDLKEKMDQYKPPIMKVQMALNPKNLGEVEVTILNRGNNLHVNITSNTNTMNLFTQNQAEFKNSLVNMGFTNLEMNFSDQRESNKEQQKGNSSNKEINEELEQGTNEDISSINLIVPRYI